MNEYCYTLRSNYDEGISEFSDPICATPYPGPAATELSANDLGDFFPEIFQFKQKCKFNNCTHINEPGCAVLEALKNEDIMLSRYNSYLNLFNNQDKNYR